MIVCVSGKHGAGKTTLAKAIADHFNLNYISAGSIFREMAEEKGMDLINFTKYAEKHPEIDKRIDKRIKQAAQKDNHVLDSQLAPFFSEQLKESNKSINILIFAKEEDRIRRISEREDVSLQKAKKEVRTREKNEKKRFKQLYGIELWNLKDFDFMLNTSRVSKQKAKKIVIDTVNTLKA